MGPERIESAPTAQTTFPAPDLAQAQAPNTRVPLIMMKKEELSSTSNLPCPRPSPQARFLSGYVPHLARYNLTNISVGDRPMGQGAPLCDPALCLLMRPKVRRESGETYLSCPRSRKHSWTSWAGRVCCWTAPSLGEGGRREQGHHHPG